jgi:hypothetical protein
VREWKPKLSTHPTNLSHSVTPMSVGVVGLPRSSQRRFGFRANVRMTSEKSFWASWASALQKETYLLLSPQSLFDMAIHSFVVNSKGPVPNSSTV